MLEAAPAWLRALAAAQERHSTSTARTSIFTASRNEALRAHLELHNGSHVSEMKNSAKNLALALAYCY
jgi:hypothetical protein